MSSGDALGVLEVVGAVAAMAAADAMLKSASIDLVGRTRVGGGRVALAVKGDIASVTAAISAGAEAARALGAVATTTTLGRPAPDVGAMAVTLSPSAAPAPAPTAAGATDSSSERATSGGAERARRKAQPGR